MKNIEIVTFELTFFKGEESKTATFSIYVVNRDEHDDPKDAAIEHYILNVHHLIGIGAGMEDYKDYLPKFKTFRVLNTRVPSDLGM
jgi:hypothetical protein